MSEDVNRRIHRAVQDHGPITFAEFMEIALYGPGGFYEDPPVGREGHFLTSPHVHPVFGQLVASGLAGLWERLGRPKPFTLVEAGAGDGTLAAQLLDWLSPIELGYVAVERSPGARARLAQLPIEVIPSLEGAGAIRDGCLFANELLDNLPFRRARRRSSGELVEVLIGTAGGRLVEIEAPAPEDLAAEAPPLARGGETAVSLAALAFVDAVATALERGYALLIDYGSTSGEPAGTVHGYRSHRWVDEILEDPGSRDVTAGVDFAAIAARAESVGLAAHGPVDQRVALSALGYPEWSDAERRRQTDLLRRGAGLRASRTWSERNLAALLIHPAGLGGLQWLTLATPELPPPPWQAAPV